MNSVPISSGFIRVGQLLKPLFARQEAPHTLSLSFLSFPFSQLFSMFRLSTIFISFVALGGGEAFHRHSALTDRSIPSYPALQTSLAQPNSGRSIVTRQLGDFLTQDVPAQCTSRCGILATLAVSLVNHSHIVLI